ncbi:MAG: hypothetical protein ACFE8M_10555 [Candidatus Hermodarchaeota archaeon]
MSKYNKLLLLTICVIVTLTLPFVLITKNSINLKDNKYNTRESPLTSSFEKEWTRTWGYNSTTHNVCVRIASDSAGNIYLGGRTFFLTTNYDMALVKFDSSGNYQWNRTWDWLGDDPDMGYGVAVDSMDNIYLAGYSENWTTSYQGVYLTLLKYSSSGVLLWNQMWGDPTAQGWAVAVDSLDNVYVGAIIPTGVALVKFDSSGNYQWNRTAGFTSAEVGYLAVDSSDNIYITGGTYTGGYGPNVFLLKYDSLGNFQWSQIWDGGGTPEVGYGVAIDSLDNIYVAGVIEQGLLLNGSYIPNSNTLLLKYDNSGSLQWNRTWDGGKNENGRVVAVDSSDDIYVGGYNQDPPQNPVIIKYNSSGVLQGNFTSDSGILQDIFVNSKNELYIGGIGSGVMFLEKYIQLPDISINYPSQNEFFSDLPPNFNIDIIESTLDTTWYTLNDGPPIIFSGLIGTINQTAWDAIGTDTVSIKFYANNSYGKVNYAEVLVFKDIDEPEILINSPMVDEIFGSVAPSYDIDITEANLDSIWYTIDGGVTNYTITLSSGIINQTAWDTRPYGNVLIRFYAEDLAGNIGFAEVQVEKTKEEEPAIFGYNLFLILISVIGMTTAVYLIKLKKIYKKS